MLKTVSEVAKLTGTTIRTLQYYDQIGLLSPKRSGEHIANNRKLYSESDIERLRKILTYKKMGFSLDEISELLSSQATDSLGMLDKRINQLLEQEDHLKNLLLLTSFSKVMGPSLFESIICNMTDPESFMSKIRNSSNYQENSDRINAWTDLDVLRRDKALKEVIEGFRSLKNSDSITYEQIEKCAEALWGWWDEFVLPLPDSGFFILWIMFSPQADLAITADDLFGEGTADSIRDYLYLMWMQDIMLTFYPVIQTVDELDSQSLDEQQTENIAKMTIDALCNCIGLDDPFAEGHELNNVYLDGTAYALTAVLTLYENNELMEFLGLNEVCKIEKQSVHCIMETLESYYEKQYQ